MDIIRKLPLKRIKTFEGVIEQNTIDKIHHKVQANVSTIQSKLDGGQSGPWYHNTKIHVTNGHRERIFMPELSSTIRSCAAIDGNHPFYITTK